MEALPDLAAGLTAMHTTAASTSGARRLGWVYTNRVVVVRRMLADVRVWGGASTQAAAPPAAPTYLLPNTINTTTITAPVRLQSLDLSGNHLLFGPTTTRLVGLFLVGWLLACLGLQPSRMPSTHTNHLTTSTTIISSSDSEDYQRLVGFVAATADVFGYVGARVGGSWMDGASHVHPYVHGYTYIQFTPYPNTTPQPHQPNPTHSALHVSTSSTAFSSLTLTRGAVRALLASPGCQHLTTLGMGGVPAGPPEACMPAVRVKGGRGWWRWVVG